jgi:hypothetical protein
MRTAQELTPRRVARLLRQAGFFPCEKRRGISVVDGFTVRRGGKNTVWVTHEIALGGRQRQDLPVALHARYRAVMLGQYARAAEAAGYTARRGAGGKVVITIKNA